MKKYQLKIDGMGCMKCVNAVKEELTALGAQIESVEIGSAAFAFDGDIEKVKEAVYDRGFEVTEVKEV